MLNKFFLCISRFLKDIKSYIFLVKNKFNSYSKTFKKKLKIKNNLNKRNGFLNIKIVRVNK